MTTRLTANLVLSCAISALAAGCTVHTYSARPEYPSTVFASHEPARSEASFHTESSRDRATYRPGGNRPAKADVRERTTSDREISRREGKPQSHAKPESHAKPQSHASARPSRNEGAAEKPRTGTKNEEHVVLMPAKPEKTKAEPTKKRSRVLSFRERVKNYVDKTNAEVAQKERARRERMNSAIGAAADKHN